MFGGRNSTEPVGHSAVFITASPGGRWLSIGQVLGWLSDRLRPVASVAFHGWAHLAILACCRLGNFDKAVTEVSSTETRRDWDDPSGRESFLLSNLAGLQMAASRMQNLK
jgi:hypothetical protein